MPRRNFSVRWEGWWYFPGDAVVDVDAGVDDRVLVSIDGKPVFERDISRGLRSGRRRAVEEKIGIALRLRSGDPGSRQAGDQQNRPDAADAW